MHRKGYGSHFVCVSVTMKSAVIILRKQGDIELFLLCFKGLGGLAFAENHHLVALPEHSLTGILTVCCLYIVLWTADTGTQCLQCAVDVRVIDVDMNLLQVVIIIIINPWRMCTARCRFVTLRWQLVLFDISADWPNICTQPCWHRALNFVDPST